MSCSWCRPHGSRMLIVHYTILYYTILCYTVKWPSANPRKFGRRKETTPPIHMMKCKSTNEAVASGSIFLPQYQTTSAQQLIYPMTVIETCQINPAASPFHCLLQSTFNPHGTTKSETQHSTSALELSQYTNAAMPYLPPTSLNGTSPSSGRPQHQDTHAKTDTTLDMPRTQQLSLPSSKKNKWTDEEFKAHKIKESARKHANGNVNTSKKSSCLETASL